MACIVGIMNKIRNVKSETAGMITFSSLLGVTGMALFLWMAGTHWVDKTGMIVSVIFLVLTCVQMGIAAVWWRLSHNLGSMELVTKVDEESIEMLKNKDNCNGNNGAPHANGDQLRLRGDGDNAANA